MTFLVDNFTDTSGTLLESHTGDSGATWAKRGTEAMAISNANRLRPNSTSCEGLYMSSVTPPSAQYDVQFTVTRIGADNGDDAGIYARINASGPISGYFVRYNGTGVLAWQLYKFVSGSATLLGSYSDTLNVNDVRTCIVKIRNGSQVVSIDGTDRITTSDADAALTGAGAVAVHSNSADAGNTLGYHLDALVATDAGAAASMVASPVFALANRTGIVVTLTGTATNWVAQTFTATGAGVTKTAQNIVSTTSATITITTVGQGGTVTISDGTISTTITVEFPPDDTNCFLSPYNWRTANGGVSNTSAITNCCGAYLKFGFNVPASTITPALRADGSTLSGTSPQISYSVDGGAWTRITVANGLNNLGSALSSGNHTIEVWLMALDDSSFDLWATVANGLKVQSINLGGQNCTSVAPTLRTKRMIVYGDSITLGRKAISSTALTGDDPMQCWWGPVARVLDAEIGAIPFGGQGYSVAPSGDNVPMLYNATDSLQSWNKYSASQSRLSGGLLSPAPDYALINHGANDGAISNGTLTANVAAFLAALRTAAGTSCKMAVVVPFNGQKDAAITAGVTADNVTKVLDCGASYAADYSLSSGSATAHALDGIHPLAFAHAQLAVKVGSLYDTAYKTLALTITTDGGGHPVLTWIADPTAVHYLVLRSTTAQGAPSLVTVVAAPTLTYTDTGGSSGNFYTIVSTTG